MKYRKKPIVIEAFQIGFDKEPNWFVGSPFVEVVSADYCHKFYIKTLEGRMFAGFGDWIIKGVNGELYPCKADIFEKTYEAAE